MVPGSHVSLLPFPKWHLSWHLCGERGEVSRVAGQGRRDPQEEGWLLGASAPANAALHRHFQVTAWHVPAHRRHPQISSSYGHAGGKRLFCWGKEKSKANLCMQKTQGWALLPMGSGSEPRTFMPLSLAVVLSWRCRKPRSLRYRHAANYTQLVHTSKAWPQCLHYKSLRKTVTKKPPTKLNSTHSCRKCFQWWKQKKNHMN